MRDDFTQYYYAQLFCAHARILNFENYDMLEMTHAQMIRDGYSKDEISKMESRAKEKAFEEHAKKHEI